MLDELGRFVIPLLSGHIGGATAWPARWGPFGGHGGDTTATDLHGLFAVDTWAKSQGLALRNAGAIKRVSGKLLDGETVRVFSEFPVAGAPCLPGLLLAGEEEPCNLYLGIHPCLFPDALQLIPPIVCAGIGCRRGIVQEILERSLRSAFQAANLCPQALGKIASIDQKAGEPDASRPLP